MPDTDGANVARPTLAIDGTDRPALALALVGLVVAEDTVGLARCEAVFGNWGLINGKLEYLFFGRDLLEFGKILTVKLGTDAIFEGRIMGLEGRYPEGRAPEVAALAEDRLQDLRMTRRTRTFADVSDAGVFQTIASEHSLTPQIDVSGPTYKVLAQVNQSDLAFLRDRARVIDAELWLDGRTLHAQSHAKRPTDTVSFSYRHNLREFQVLADLAHQRTSVFVDGWDVAGKQAIRHEATASAIQAELDGGDSGPSVLRSALGDRAESLAHAVPETDAEAQSHAESAYRLLARRFVVGRGVAEADSRLRAGRHVQLDGLGHLFDGGYFLAEVRHVFDDVHGIRTEFTAERPGLGRP